MRAVDRLPDDAGGRPHLKQAEKDASSILLLDFADQFHA
jgi:hypothetical protein